MGSTMSADLGELVAVQVLVTLVLVLLHLRTTWRWEAKAASIVLASLGYLLAYYSAPNLLGWPTSGQVPAKFKLLGVMIEEPDPERNSKGAIYFWGADLAPASPKAPRAYQLPYTQSLKAQFSEAHGKMRRNIPQIGEVDDPDAPVGVAIDRSQLGQSSLKIKIKDAPAEGAPVKDAPQ